jgi:hypothetical protein
VSGSIIFHVLWIATALRVLLPCFADPDLWGHVLFGNVLLSGTLPAVNGFAYTAPQHPWVNHEILAETAMAAVFNDGGALGLVVLKVVIGLATLFIVWRAALRRSRHPGASAVATALAAAIMAPGLMIRPQLFTLLFLAATLAELAKEDFRPRRRAWALPLLAVVWVNTHGGVLAGVGLAAIGVLVALAARMREGGVTRRDAGMSLAFVAALVGALFVNPYGATLVRFLLTDVTPAVPITEWAPVSPTDLSFALFKGVLLVVVLGLLLGRRGRPPEVAVLAAATLAAFLHRRHIPLFAIAAAPLLAAVVADAWVALARRAGDKTLRMGVAAVAALQIVVAVQTGVTARGRIVVDPWRYPVQAFRFLAQNDIAGNVAVPFDWGEYALWSLPAGSRVAIDGRFTTAYPRALLDEAWRFMGGGEEWDALLTRYPTEIVVADRRQAPARLLRDAREWAYVYSDPVSVVFIRRVATQTGTLERFAAGSFRYDSGPLDTSFPGPFQGGSPTSFVPTAACRTARYVPGSIIPESTAARDGADCNGIC